MFQKLYRHLEEANATLRRQENAINATNSHSEDIVRQLERMHEEGRASRRLAERTSKRLATAVPVVLLLVVVFCLGTIVILNNRLSRLTNEFSDGMRSANQATSTRQQDVASQLTRLDSTVARQSQNLDQLKDLNMISARSFVQMKSKIDQTNRLIHSLQADSGRTGSAKSLAGK